MKPYTTGDTSSSPANWSRVSDDRDSGVQQTGAQIKEPKLPVTKSTDFKAKALLNRFIQIVKPQFMRRREVDAIWRKADLKMYEFVQAVTLKKDTQVVKSAMDEVFSAVAPLTREKEGTPDLARLVGSRMLNQIRTMNLEELESLATNLNNVWQEGPDDPTGLFLYSVRATILHKQAYAIQKEANMSLFEPNAGIKLSELSVKVLRKLASLHDDAQALIKPTKGFKKDEVLPGTQLKLNRLLLIAYWAEQAKKHLEVR